MIPLLERRRAHNRRPLGGGSSDADSKASIVSFNNPTLNGVAGDNSLRLPKTVTAQYSDGSSKDVDVTWSGNGYTADADLMNLPAGTGLYY